MSVGKSHRINSAVLLFLRDPCWSTDVQIPTWTEEAALSTLQVARARNSLDRRIRVKFYVKFMCSTTSDITNLFTSNFVGFPPLSPVFSFTLTGFLVDNSVSCQPEVFDTPRLNGSGAKADKAAMASGWNIFIWNQSRLNFEQIFIQLQFGNSRAPCC